MDTAPATFLSPVFDGRLVRDRRIELARVAAHAALDQPAIAHMHRAVEGLAVEPVGVDIMEEVGGGDRRVDLDRAR